MAQLIQASGAQAEESVRPAPPPTGPDGHRRERRWLLHAGQIGTVIALLVIVQWLVDSGRVGSIYLASPTQVWSAFIVLLTEKQLVGNLLVTLAEAMIGLAAALVVGVATGLAIGLWSSFGRFIAPFLSAGMAVPKVTLIPLIALYLGIGAPAKTFIVFLFTYFIFVYNTIAGIRNVDERLVKVMRSYGASRWQITRKVLLPSASVSITAALNVTAGTAVVGALFGELGASERGLGNLLSQSMGLYDTASTFALVIICTLFSAGLIAAISWLESSVLLRWKKD